MSAPKVVEEGHLTGAEEWALKTAIGFMQLERGIKVCLSA
jgi:hypothetical protein